MLDIILTIQLSIKIEKLEPLITKKPKVVQKEKTVPPKKRGDKSDVYQKRGETYDEWIKRVPYDEWYKEVGPIIPAG